MLFIQNKHYKKTSKGETKLKKLAIYVYLGLMLIFYLGYSLMENYRLYKGEQWDSANYLSESDFQEIHQLATWNDILEFLFIGLFILAAFSAIFLYRYHNNSKVLIRFIVSHLCLFAGIFLIGYVLSIFLTAPIGNLVEPLFSSAFVLIGMVIYTTFVIMGKRVITRRA